MTKLRVFLADDHDLVREALKRQIEAMADLEVVDDGTERKGKATHVKSDVTVLDLSMREFSGTGVTTRLEQVCSGTRVLVVGALETDRQVRELLDAGAAGYMRKRLAAHELGPAIRIVADGGVYLNLGSTMVVTDAARGAQRTTDRAANRAEESEVGTLLEASRKAVRTARLCIEHSRQAISISQQLTGRTAHAAQDAGKSLVRANDVRARTRRSVRRVHSSPERYRG